MKNLFALSALFAFILLLVSIVGCATMKENWKALPTVTKTLVITEGIRIVLKPECVRLGGIGAQYVDLCNEGIEDVIAAVNAGITKDASLICPGITAKADLCSRLPDESVMKQQNIATCERVIRSAGLACTVFLTKPLEPEPAS